MIGFSDNPRKVPRIITFYVEDCPDPKEQGGVSYN